MDEEQIEQALRARLEKLDQDYVSTPMTPGIYRARWRAIEDWAQRQFAICRSSGLRAQAGR